MLRIQTTDAIVPIPLQLAAHLPTLLSLLEATTDDDESAVLVPFAQQDMQDIVLLLQGAKDVPSVPDSQLYNLLRAFGFLGGGPLYNLLLHRLRDRIKEPTFEPAWLQ
jgi:hypothetical protein